MESALRTTLDPHMNFSERVEALGQKDPEALKRARMDTVAETAVEGYHVKPLAEICAEFGLISIEDGLSMEQVKLSR